MRHDLKATAELVRRAQSGDEAAFDQLTQHYANLALGYAYSLLGDFHLAEDAAQEAFVAAYFGMARLQEAEAFPAWLRGIVRHQCARQTRVATPQLAPESDSDAYPDEADTPPQCIEREELKQQTLAAIASLPPAQREVVVLFYLHFYSQKEIALFLGIAPTQVNNRLYAARQKLQRKLIAMKIVDETLQNQTVSPDFAARVGRIINVRGTVVEAQFDAPTRPEVFDALEVELAGGTASANVTQRLSASVVRAVVTGTLALGLMSGLPAARAEEARPLSDAEVANAVRTLGAPRAPDATPSGMETGIKTLDLLCPLPQGGKIGIFGTSGVGGSVLLEELIHRLNQREQSASIFYFLRPVDAIIPRNIADEHAYPGDVSGHVQVFWILTNRATDPDFPAMLPDMDVSIFLSPTAFARGIYPAIDPLRSSSRLENHLPKTWRDLARRVRETLKRGDELMVDPTFLELVAMRANPNARRRDEEFAATRLPQLGEEERLLASRARKIARFLSQPFDMAAPWTGVPGATLTQGQILQDFAAILDGEVDDWPESAFSMAAGLDDVARRVQSPKLK